MPSTEQDTLPGMEQTVIAGRYQLIRQLGQGGMGTVYLVRHVNTHEQLAMKVLRKELVGQPEAVERFKREMKASALLKSDNVTRITDADTAQELDGSLYMVMELLDGVDLEKLLRGKKPLDPVSAIFILGQAARALDKAHSLKIIHRDLKPENLFLHRSPELGLIVKVLDFGIAMFQSPVGSTEMRLTQDQSVLGTPLYMAPEQILGNRDQIAPQTDMWALAMIAYDMLVGECYWQVPNLAQLVSRIALLKQPAPSSQAPSLPKTFDLWFAKACAYEAGDRFQSVTEQVDALAYALQVDPAWLDATIPPDTLLARFNEASPPKQESVRSRSHSALTTARGKTASLVTGSSFRTTHVASARRSKLRWLWLLPLLLLLVASALWYRGRGQRHVETTAENVEPKSAGKTGAAETEKTAAAVPSSGSGTSSDSQKTEKEDADSARKKGPRVRTRSRTDGNPPAAPAAKHRKTEYDPVAP